VFHCCENFAETPHRAPCLLCPLGANVAPAAAVALISLLSKALRRDNLLDSDGITLAINGHRVLKLYNICLPSLYRCRLFLSFRTGARLLGALVAICVDHARRMHGN
jgi:hypothetical protein